MSSVQKIFIACLAFIALSACGLKGDLYLPEAEPQKVETPKLESIISQENSEPAIKEENPTP